MYYARRPTLEQVRELADAVADFLRVAGPDNTPPWYETKYGSDDTRSYTEFIRPRVDRLRKALDPDGLGPYHPMKVEFQLGLSDPPDLCGFSCCEIEHVCEALFDVWDSHERHNRREEQSGKPEYQWKLHAPLGLSDLAYDKLRWALLKIRKYLESLDAANSRPAPPEPGGPAPPSLPKPTPPLPRILEGPDHQAEPPEPQSAEKASPPPRLVVSRNPPHATLDGQTFALSHDQAEFLEVLNRHGDRITRPADFAPGSSLLTAYHRNRTKKRLPAPLKDCVVGQEGGGYRLELPPLQ